MFPCRSLKLTLPPSEMASTYLHNCRRPHSPIKFVKEISMQCTQHLNRYQKVRFPEDKISVIFVMHACMTMRILLHF